MNESSNCISVFSEFPMFFLNVEINDDKMQTATRLTDPIPTMTLPPVETMKMFAEKLRLRLLQNRFLPRPCNNSLS